MPISPQLAQVAQEMAKTLFTMKFLTALSALSVLLSFAPNIAAQPHARHLDARRLHHHHHSRNALPTATGTGGSVAAAPTGFYPTGNETVWPSGSMSGCQTGTGIAAYQAASSTTSASVNSTAATSLPGVAVVTRTVTAEASTVSSIVYVSSTTSSATPTVKHETAATSIPFLRGVNVGSWLILEKWMASSVFSGDAANAVDQWTYDQTPNAAANLQQHWSTWFTQADVQQLASYGFNALRIPIGYWAYDNSNTPFIQGADAFLEQAIGWARDAGMYVWVDCHGSPGSQNGQDHSGHAGPVEWQQGNNLQQSTDILVTMAKKYGTNAYADVVVGLEMVNEPAAGGNNSFSTSQSWAQSTFQAIKAVVENQNLVIITHDSFQGPDKFNGIAQTLNGNAGTSGTFGVDVHDYSLYTDSDNSLNQAQHISQACGWGAPLKAAQQYMPVYVGEWSTITNTCVLSDGSTVAGTSCSQAGCQCQSAPQDQWNDSLKEQVRRFIEAQLDTYEQNANGYFLWSWNGPGSWGIVNDINAGVFPNPVTSRTYPGQCN